LKNYGDVGLRIGNRFLVPINLTGRGRDSPANMRSIVDLPEPEGPSRATISPGTMERSVAEIT